MIFCIKYQVSPRLVVTSLVEMSHLAILAVYSKYKSGFQTRLLCSSDSFDEICKKAGKKFVELGLVGASEYFAYKRNLREDEPELSQDEYLKTLYSDPKSFGKRHHTYSGDDEWIIDIYKMDRDSREYIKMNLDDKHF